MTFYSRDQTARARRVIGLAAREPVSGIDSVAVEIDGERISAVAHLFIAFDESLRLAIGDARRAAGCGPSAMTALNVALGLAFADAAARVRAVAAWKRKDVDAIGVEGVTIWLQASPIELGGAFVTGTLEFGDAASVAEAMGAPVVSGFRASDLAAGGNGEPVAAVAAGLPPSFAASAIGKDSDVSRRAVAVSVLADRTLLGIPGASPEATGAARPIVLGSVTPG